MTRRRYWIVAIIALVAIGGAGTPLVIARVFELPAPTGRFAVGTVALAMREPADVAVWASPTMVEIWYPARAGSPRARYGYANHDSRSPRWLVPAHAASGAALAGTTERFPVLVYASGWRGRRTDNTMLAEELASQGYVVVAFDDIAIGLPPDAKLAPPWSFATVADFDRTMAVGEVKVALEARMASAMLDGLARLDADDPSGRFTHRLDLGRAAIMGFSFGGAVAAEACRRDPRFRAAMNLDGYLFGTASKEGFDQPYFLANTVDTSTPFPVADPADPVTRRIDELNRIDEEHQNAILTGTGGYVLLVDRTSHMDFSDAPFFSIRRRWARRASDDPVAIVRLLGGYAVAFFDSVLNGTPPGPPLTGPSPDPRATLRTYR